MTTRANRQVQFPILYIIDDLIKRGRVQSARRELKGLDPKKIPRKFLAETAGLGRRASLSHWALTLLHPYVRPTHATMKATDEELIEYAANLTRVGAIQEAWDVLKKVDDKKHPSVSLYRSFVCVLRWDYAASIPFLESYLKSATLSDYERVLGKMNLAAAFVDQYDGTRAKPLLAELVLRCERNGHFLLLASALKLQAQLAIQEKNYTWATEILARAEKLLGETGGQDSFLVRKLIAVLGVCEDPKAKSAWEKFAHIEKEALRLNHWESIRDCERWRARLLKDETLVAKLYFGTPFEAFRKRLLEEFQSSPPQNYDWHIGAGQKPVVLDLRELDGDIDKRRSLGEHPWMLLQALSSDFYRPLSIAYLHAVLYPGEFYNPGSSRSRVKMSVVRLRQWLKSRKIPLGIVHEEKGYSLQATKPLVIRFSRGELNASRHDVFLSRLAEKFSKHAFSAREAAEALAQPFRSVQRALEIGMKSGKLQRTGKGAATKYQVK